MFILAKEPRLLRLLPARLDKWTGELFSQVTTPKETEQKDFANPATMEVNCFIYAADKTPEGSSASALAAARDWANGLK